MRHTQTCSSRSLTHDLWVHTPCSDEGPCSQPVRDGHMHSGAISCCKNLFRCRVGNCDTQCVGCMQSCAIQIRVSLAPAPLEPSSRCLSLLTQMGFSLMAGVAKHTISCSSVQEDLQSRQRRPTRVFASIPVIYDHTVQLTPSPDLCLYPDCNTGQLVFLTASQRSEQRSVTMSSWCSPMLSQHPTLSLRQQTWH